MRLSDNTNLEKPQKILSLARYMPRPEIENFSYDMLKSDRKKCRSSHNKFFLNASQIGRSKAA